MSSSADVFDTIIVGAGPAGCLLANRLSADPDHRVLLLEAGGKDDYPWIHIPVGYLYCIGNPRTDWCFTTEAVSGLNGRSLGYPRGRVLGGCSSINGMIYMRGQAADYDRWAAMGNPGWAWQDVLPLFKWVECHADGDNDWHGCEGEWRVEHQRFRWEILEAFRAAADECGIPPVEDFNRGDNSGSGYFQVNQKRGIRWNASKAFLRGIRHRPNLKIVTEAEIDRVIFTDESGTPRATGVIGHRRGQPRQWQARREVILSAGAIGSPTILQRSGIGPRELLVRHGIAPLRHAPGVGANLQDHLQLRMIYRVEGVGTLNQIVPTLAGKLGMGWQYLTRRSGPLSMAPSQLGLFARSSPELATPDLEYHVQPLSLERFGEPLHPFPAFTASVCHLRPESRGSVEIGDASPSVKPRIQPNYLATEADRRVAVAAIRLTRRIVAASPLARYHPQEIKPGDTYQSDEELAHAAGDIGTTIFHPVGTCRMGTDPEAVVDARLRVHGVRGLRVADASIMPTITSGNTCSPTVMIAEKAAEMILEERAKPPQHHEQEARDAAVVFK